MTQKAAISAPALGAPLSSPAASVPGDVDFLFPMAKNHHQAGRLDQAERIYRQILGLSATHAASLHLLGLVMHQRGNSKEAFDLIDASLKENPNDAEAQNNMGNVLRRLGRASEAIECFQTAVRLAPGFAGVYNNLGLTLRQLGCFPEAAKQFRQAIKYDPNLAEAWAGLAKTGRLSLKEEEVIAAESILNNKKLSNVDQRYICFALGKHFDAIQQWDQAFSYYKRANSLGDASPDKGASSRLLTAILDHPVLSPEGEAPSDDPAESTAVPIFIFGMPRSGSTLVEQILASHPSVSSGGELNIIESELRQMFPELVSGDASALDHMTPAQCGHLKEIFMAAVRVPSDNRGGIPIFYTDKSLLNFAYLPGILRIFPDARLVHCRRNPIDTCLSVYFTDFKVVYDYTNDLDNIGAFYCLYHQIMEKWKVVLPDVIFDIHYEDLLDDQEETTRKLLDYCGLTWDDVCLRFFETDRQVSTPSDWQVRLPIFSSSRNRWKHYEEHLGGLIRSLDTCI
jgi:Flp pilus assembly protein TadD